MTREDWSEWVMLVGGTFAVMFLGPAGAAVFRLLFL